MNSPSRQTSVRPASCAASRGGFTLVELLVVVAIIGLLAALLIPAVGVMRRKAYEMQVNVEISQIQTALNNFANKYGAPPPDFSDVEAGTPWNQSVAYRFIRKTWPKINAVELTFVQYLAQNPTGSPDPINYLDNDTVVWFWLSGLSESSTHPFTGPGGPLSADALNNQLFAFVEDRVLQARATIPSTDGNNPTGRDIVIYHYVPYRIEKPYIYFDARTYDQAVFDASVFGVGADFARPYFLDPAVDNWAEKSNFQIIASGRDEVFSGPTVGNGDGVVYPVAYPKAGWHPPATLTVPPDFYETHLDNFTNFGKVLRDFERP